MFELETPVLELVSRAVLIYLFLLLLVRISGKRTVGEFTPFDLIVVILLGEAAQAGLAGDESSVSGSMILAATLIALNLTIAFVTARSHPVQRLVEGEPVLLVRAGKVLEKALRRNHVPVADLEEAARQANLGSLSEVDAAMLEVSGEITIVPKAKQS